VILEDDDHKVMQRGVKALERIADFLCDEPARGKEVDWPRTAELLTKEMKIYLESKQNDEAATVEKSVTKFWLQRLWEIRKGY
jgi:hypothetical protein